MVTMTRGDIRALAAADLAIHARISEALARNHLRPVFERELAREQPPSGSR